MHIQSMCQQNTVFTTYMSVIKKVIFIYYVCIYMCPKLAFLLGGHHCEMTGPAGIRHSQRKWYFPLKKDSEIYFYYG